MQRNAKFGRKPEELLKLRDAALQLGISFPTIKQWIYKKKIRSIRTAGGHHRIPESEVDRLLFRTRGRTEKERKQVIRRVSGRNQISFEDWMLLARRVVLSDLPALEHRAPR